MKGVGRKNGGVALFLILVFLYPIDTKAISLRDCRSLEAYDGIVGRSSPKLNF